MAARLRPVPTGPLLGVAMVRVSKVGDRGDDLLSPDLQREAITAYAKSRGIRIVEWIEAIDESGSTARSPWWARLDQAVTMVECGQVQAVLVWKYSRAARHRRNWAVALDRVEVAGGVLESATEQLDTTTSTGRLSRGILAELSAWEAEIKSEQWKETQAHRLAVGLPHTPTARFGYVYDREARAYRIDPDTAPLVAGLYARYIAGEGALALAAWLNSLGVKGRRGGEWNRSTVGRMMQSGFAAGRLVRHGQLVDGAQPRIIDEATWTAYLTQHRRNVRLPTRLRAPRNALSGVLVCGLCWGRMTSAPHPTRAGVPKRMFRCATNTADRSCPGVYVTEKTALAAIFGWLREQASDVQARTDGDVLRKVARASAKAERRRLAAELVKVNDGLRRLAVRDATSDMPQEVYAAARDELLSARSAALERIADLTDEATVNAAPVGPRARNLLQAWDGLDNTARRQGLLDLMRYATVTKGPPGRPSVVTPRAHWER